MTGVGLKYVNSYRGGMQGTKMIMAKPTLSDLGSRCLRIIEQCEKDNDCAACDFTIIEKLYGRKLTDISNDQLETVYSALRELKEAGLIFEARMGHTVFWQTPARVKQWQDAFLADMEPEGHA
jgi:hypothetical protein